MNSQLRAQTLQSLCDYVAQHFSGKNQLRFTTYTASQFVNAAGHIERLTYYALKMRTPYATALAWQSVRFCVQAAAKADQADLMRALSDLHFRPQQQNTIVYFEALPLRVP